MPKKPLTAVYGLYTIAQVYRLRQFGMSGLTKDTRRLIQEAKTWEGWRVVDTSDGWMIYPPDKSLPGISVHRTPSDQRALANTKARLRRSGAPI